MNHCKIDELGRALCVNWKFRDACDFAMNSHPWLPCSYQSEHRYENLSGLRVEKLCNNKDAAATAKMDDI